MFSLPNRKALPALLALMLLVLTIVSCKNFFPEAKLTSIAVSPSTASLVVGGTAPLVATGTYDNGNSKDLTQSVSWVVSVSSPNGAATVSNTAGTKGVVTGVSAGTATVTASSGGATPAAWSTFSRSGRRAAGRCPAPTPRAWAAGSSPASSSRRPCSSPRRAACP